MERPISDILNNPQQTSLQSRGRGGSRSPAERPSTDITDTRSEPSQASVHSRGRKAVRPGRQSAVKSTSLIDSTTVM
jgi:hypothetical protein